MKTNFTNKHNKSKRAKLKDYSPNPYFDLRQVYLLDCLGPRGCIVPYQLDRRRVVSKGVSL